MTVILSEPDPAWADAFQALGRSLRSVLGEDALRIDHIGSTAVPGLCAKPVIDIQLTVAELALSLDQRLMPLGYELRAGTTADHAPPRHAGPPQDWHKRYYRRSAPLPRVHLHVRVAGRANQRYALLCRDYLRAEAGMALAYGELKRRLVAALRPEADYADVKDPAMDLIYLAAEAWAAQHAWQAGASDA